MDKRILFLTRQQNHALRFWTPEAADAARRLGFVVDIPALEGNLPPAFPWPSAGGYDALLTTWGSPVCSRTFLGAFPRARILGHAAGSVAAVADESTFERGLRVVSANPVMAGAVAEWSLMATLMAQRGVAAYMGMGGGRRLRWERRHEMMADLRELTIGVWGCGDIARRLLPLLAPLRPARLLVYSDHAPEAELRALGGEKVSFERLFAESDILHCLAGANRGNLWRIGARELALLKPGMTLVNAGRANLFQEGPLLDTLRSGRINAVLDVFHEEPLGEQSPFRELDNVVLTPHNAGYPGQERYLPFLLEEFGRFFRGEPLTAEVEPRRFANLTDDRLPRRPEPPLPVPVESSHA